MTFNTYKFRCSSLGKLMVEPRSKKAREAGELSETTKTYLKELWIEEKYNRTKDIYNKYMAKGQFAEEDSIDLLCDVRNMKILKNKDKLENEFITGTPDIILDHVVIDLKTKWDIWGFGKEEAVTPSGANRNYWWQLQGYMWLTGVKNAEVVFTLVDTPEHLMYSEYAKIASSLNLSSKDESELDEEIRKALTYSDMPKEDRLKGFAFPFDQVAIDELKERIKGCRNYMNNLSL